MHLAVNVISLLQSLTIVGVDISAIQAAAECSSMGSDLRMLSHRFRKREGLFLNFGAPSQCRGIVTGWHYCYGMSECETGAKYHATFMVYRPSKNHTSGELSVVPESIESVSLVCQNKSKVKCDKEKLLLSKQFTIQENDIVAVCLVAEREHRLQLISRMYDEDDYTEEGIYQHSNEMIQDCKSNHIQTINLKDITLRKSLQIHLHAEIAASKGQILTDPNYTLRFNDPKEKWYLKAIPASIAGLTILTVFVVVVAGMVLKCRQTLSSYPGHVNTIATCDPIAHVPQATTDMSNDYTLNENVAYSAPTISTHRTLSQLQDENIYEIV